jgi:hypothetical protein
MSNEFSFISVQSNQASDMLLLRQLADIGVYFFYEEDHNEVYNYEYSLKFRASLEFSFSKNGSNKAMIRSTNRDSKEKCV